VISVNNFGLEKLHKKYVDRRSDMFSGHTSGPHNRTGNISFDDMHDMIIA